MDLKSKLGAKTTEENPFVTSDDFLKLLKSASQLMRCILLASTNPGEAMNAIQSLVVTLLKNIPDVAWAAFMEIQKKRGESPPATFTHLDAIRSYGCEGQEKFVEIIDEGEGDIPPVNAPIPNQPC